MTAPLIGRGRRELPSGPRVGPDGRLQHWVTRFVESPTEPANATGYTTAPGGKLLWEVVEWEEARPPEKPTSRPHSAAATIIPEAIPLSDALMVEGLAQALVELAHLLGIRIEDHAGDAPQLHAIRRRVRYAQLRRRGQVRGGLGDGRFVLEYPPDKADYEALKALIDVEELPLAAVAVGVADGVEGVSAATAPTAPPPGPLVTRRRRRGKGRAR